MKKNIAVIFGDGIGPEVTRQSIKVLNAIAQQFDHQFNYKYCLLGADAIDKTGNPLPKETIEVCSNSDAILFGAIGLPKYDSDPTAKVRPEQGLMNLRKSLQLFANIRPVTTYPALYHLAPLKKEKLEGVDFIIYRELTSGTYFGEKHVNDEFTEAYDVCEYNRSEIERITHLAFKAAETRKRKLTLVDKANVLETSRLWRKVVQDIAKSYPQVMVDYMFVDNAVMQIVINPTQFDIILSDNMFGDIISDEASVLSGSLGLLPSASVGVSNAMFEPIHGSYPQAAGKDIANPIGSILSAAMMLEYFNMHEEAKLVKDAVLWTQSNGFVTKDINTASFYFTNTIGDLICDYVNNRVHPDINPENIELRKSTII
jgi:3-isopropylmalate dehydrogenase